jgi:hypothetical protein
MANENLKFSNVGPSPPQSAFTLRGGKYMVMAHAASWSAGSATLELMAADGATFLPVSSALTFAADGVVIADLGPGTYNLVIATTTGVYVSIVGIPDAIDAIAALQVSLRQAGRLV